MIPFPDKKYDIIYADPPWSYSDKGCNGNAADRVELVAQEGGTDEQYHQRDPAREL